MIQRAPDMHQQQIEVIDTLGRVVAWFHSSFDAEGSRMTLTLTPSDRSHARRAPLLRPGAGRDRGRLRVR